MTGGTRPLPPGTAIGMPLGCSPRQTVCHTSTTLSFVLILLNSLITPAAFSGVLWAITPWLVVAAVVYALFGSLMTLVLGYRLVGFNVLQLHEGVLELGLDRHLGGACCADCSKCLNGHRGAG